MAGIVKSVETFQVVITNGNGSAAIPITDTIAATTIGDCVPFVTKRCTDPLAFYEVEAFQVDAWFTGADTLNVARDNTSGDLEVEVSVVEFDSTLCNVYSGDFELTSSGASDFVDVVSIGGTVDLARSFLVFHSLQNSSGGIRWDSHLIRGRITSTTEVTFDRQVGEGTSNGTWYVVECKGTEFESFPIDVALADSETGQDTSFSVDKSKSFVVGSWRVNGTVGNVATSQNTVDVTLTSGTQLDIQRVSGAGTIDWHGFIVEMADGTSVEHGTIVAQGAIADADITLTTAVSLTRSTAIMSGNHGSTCAGSFPGILAADVTDAMVQLTLEDVGSTGSFNNLNVRHHIGATSADNDISWEVIEWGEGGGAPATRRVMVR